MYIVRAFYSNMEISTSRKNTILTNVDGVYIKFDVGGSNSCSTIFFMLMRLGAFVGVATISMIFATFLSIPNSYPHRFEYFTTSFNILLLLGKGMLMRLLVWMLVLDCIIRHQLINVRFVIMRHMLSTLGVSNRLLPYCSIITKILRHVRVPLYEPVYKKSKMLREEAVTASEFHRRNVE